MRIPFEDEVINISSSSSLLNETKEMPMLRKLSNEIEDVTSSSSSGENSAYFTSVNSPTKVVDDIEENIEVSHVFQFFSLFSLFQYWIKNPEGLLPIITLHSCAAIKCFESILRFSRRSRYTKFFLADRGRNSTKDLKRN